VILRVRHWLVLCSLCSTSAVVDAQSFRLPTTSGPGLLHQCSRNTPKDVSGFWVPSAADIAKLEALLVPFLRSSLETRLILPADPLTRFHRQYIGFIRDGKRYIYGNFYPHRSESDPREATDPVNFCDGGDQFWGVVFSLDTQQFEDLSYNGVA
jgi:hypothetical protein